MCYTGFRKQIKGEINMVRNEIWIGDNKRGTTWILCWNNVGNSSISESNISYWCGLRNPCNFTLRICKDTTEGKHLKALLDTKKELIATNKSGYTLGQMVNDDLVIHNYICECLMKNINTEEFSHMLTEQYKEGYNHGKRDKLSEIKKVLEIDFEN